jgi:hypothetical protein
MEAGLRGGDSQAWERRLFKAAGVSLYIPAELDGKVVERVVAEQLSEEAERRELLSNRQCRSRKGRSAIDAVAIMVDRAHAAQTHGYITGVLLVDIKAAFLHMIRGSLVNLMMVRQINGDLIRWTESFPLDRLVEMIIEGNTIERH